MYALLRANEPRGIVLGVDLIAFFVGLPRSKSTWSQARINLIRI
jgi:hypothetical protein